MGVHYGYRPSGNSPYSSIDIITNGLSVYLDATNSASYSGSGSTWIDLSGNGRNFTWVSTPTFTSGTPSYFTTLGNRCQGPASNSFGIDNTSGYTIFLIMKQNSLQSTAAFKFYTSGSDAANRGIFAHCTWSDDNVYFDQGGGASGSSQRTYVASGGSTTWNVWTFRRLTGSSTRSISKNATTLITNTDAASDINLVSTLMDLGSTDAFGGNSSTWDARLGGFIVYNRGLNDTELTSVHNTIKTRYGIA
jgi:hypothetical protein